MWHAGQEVTRVACGGRRSTRERAIRKRGAGMVVWGEKGVAAMERKPKLPPPVPERRRARLVCVRVGCSRRETKVRAWR